MAKHKILVVDDEESLCEILQFNLEVEGYEADVAYSAEQALRMHPERYSLILLDVMMGEMSGFRMAQLLKADPETARVPVIFCTAKDSEDDTVAGLNIGADDYITKPFSVREVLARVRSVLRRTSAARAESESIRFEGLEIDLRRKVCTLDGKELQLTKKEFEILALLLSNRGVIFSREEILRRIKDRAAEQKQILLTGGCSCCCSSFRGRWWGVSSFSSTGAKSTSRPSGSTRSCSFSTCGCSTP